MPKKNIILVFHGSRRPSTMTEARNLVGEVAAGLPDVSVSLGFLQFCQPAFEEVLAGLLREGLKEIIILPMFALTGAHVEQDIPEIVAKFRLAHPQTAIHLLPHLSAQPLFLKWVGSFLSELSCSSSLQA